MIKTMYIVLLLNLLVIITFGQNNNDTNKNGSTFSINTGKSFSNYRYFKNYNAYENININFTKKLSGKTGLTLSQSYDRLFESETNSRALMFNSNILLNIAVLNKEKYSVNILTGTGLKQIYIKCLYEEYPLKRRFYGIPIVVAEQFLYHYSSKISFSFSLISSYDFLFNNSNSLFYSENCYQTFFNTVSIGIVYGF